MMVSFWLLYFAQFTVNGVVTSNSFCTVKHLTNNNNNNNNVGLFLSSCSALWKGSCTVLVKLTSKYVTGH